MDDKHENVSTIQALGGRDNPFVQGRSNSSRSSRRDWGGRQNNYPCSRSTSTISRSSRSRRVRAGGEIIVIAVAAEARRVGGGTVVGGAERAWEGIIGVITAVVVTAAESAVEEIPCRITASLTMLPCRITASLTTLPCRITASLITLVTTPPFLLPMLK